MTPSATNGSPCFKTVGEVAPVIFNAVAAKEGREKLTVRKTTSKIDKIRFFITTLLVEVSFIITYPRRNVYLKSTIF